MCSACSGNYQDDYENPEDDDRAGGSTGCDFVNSAAQADADRHRNARALRPSAASGAGATRKLHDTTTHCAGVTTCSWALIASWRSVLYALTACRISGLSTYDQANHKVNITGDLGKIIRHVNLLI